MISTAAFAALRRRSMQAQADAERYEKRLKLRSDAKSVYAAACSKRAMCRSSR